MCNRRRECAGHSMSIDRSISRCLLGWIYLLSAQINGGDFELIIIKKIYIRYELASLDIVDLRAAGYGNL